MSSSLRRTPSGQLEVTQQTLANWSDLETCLERVLTLKSLEPAVSALPWDEGAV